MTAPPVRHGERVTGVPRANVDVSAYFDLDHGLIDRTIFSDRALYQQELRRVFAPSWLFLAHESQFGRPGDFFTTYMGEDPVIVAMGRDRKLRAFLNACRHRGMRVCRADAGAAKAFTCSYHGWSYDMSGKLVNVPNQDD
nr:Rieske 2Fe-2S domain-containing protein [Streptomyces scabiei]